MAEINKITGLVKGQYGIAIPLTIVDDAGNAINISSYTGAITITARAPYARAIKTFSGVFVTDGSNGQIQFTPTSTNTFDEDGDWEGQVELNATNTKAKTVPFTFTVKDSLT